MDRTPKFLKSKFLSVLDSSNDLINGLTTRVCRNVRIIFIKCIWMNFSKCKYFFSLIFPIWAHRQTRMIMTLITKVDQIKRMVFACHHCHFILYLIIIWFSLQFLLTKISLTLNHAKWRRNEPMMKFPLKNIVIRISLQVRWINEFNIRSKTCKIISLI